MAIRVLTNPNAFSGGAQLWVTPGPQHSLWTKKIDWYLNLQIRRSEKHVAPNLSPDLEGIMQENELPIFRRQPDESAPLLISCEGQLPVHAIAKLEFLSDAKAWLEKMHQVWMGLGRPQIRVFLPESVSVEEFKAFWSEKDDHLVSVVPHSTLLN